MGVHLSSREVEELAEVTSVEAVASELREKLPED
jgi:hypothetical protein